MKTSATNRRLRVLLTAISSGTLIPQPEFQRRLVWSNKDKLSFVETVLKGYPFPEIYIAGGDVNSDTAEGTELLVDGQQRITTLFQYFRSSTDLKLTAGISPYSSLTEEKKLAFLSYEVVVRDLGNLPIGEVKEIFQRINSTSYGLNAMEIHNSRYGGEFKEFGDKFASKGFFEKIGLFTANDVRRMNDTRYCLILVITMLSTYTNRDHEVESYLERYNENFELKTKLNNHIEKVIKFIVDLNLDVDSRAWKKADFYTLFIEIHVALEKAKLKLSKNKVEKKLKGFYEKVESSTSIEDENSIHAKYYKATLQASNDRKSRISRGSVIADLLLECQA